MHILQCMQIYMHVQRHGRAYMYIFCACMYSTMHTLPQYRYVLIHTNAGDPYQAALMVVRDVRLVESAPSKFGGLGLMASRNFEAGDVILVETPFLSVQVFHV